MQQGLLASPRSTRLRQTWCATGKLLLVVRGKPGATGHVGTAAGLAKKPPAPESTIQCFCSYSVLLLGLGSISLLWNRLVMPSRSSWRRRCLIRHGGDCSVSGLLDAAVPDTGQANAEGHSICIGSQSASSMAKATPDEADLKGTIKSSYTCIARPKSLRLCWNGMSMRWLA